MVIEQVIIFIGGIITGWTLCKCVGERVRWGRFSVQPKWGWYRCIYHVTAYFYLALGWHFIEVKLPYNWRKR